MKTKYCNNCYNTYPLTEEYFYWEKNSLAKNGMYVRCRHCVRKNSLTCNDFHPDLAINDPNNFRVCRKCKETYPLTNEYFYYDKGRLKHQCKSCILKRTRLQKRKMRYANKYRKIHKTEINEYRKEWMNDNEVQKIKSQKNAKKYIEQLADSYIISLIHNKHKTLTAKDIKMHPDWIESKRKIIHIQRLNKQLKIITNENS